MELSKAIEDRQQSQAGPDGRLRLSVMMLALILAPAWAASDSWIGAIDHGDIGVLHRLAEQVVDVDAPGKRGKTALMLASAHGDLKLVRRLLDLGADPNRFNQTGGNALMYAAQYNRTEVARTLIERGADVSAQGGKFWSALMIAVLKGHTALVDLLLARGADPDARDMLGATPLIRAVERRHAGITRHLIDTGAVDLNASDKQGVTALHLAAAAGDIETVRLLLAHGARTDLVSADGHTPVMIAEQAGHTTIADLLRKRP